MGELTASGLGLFAPVNNPTIPFVGVFGGHALGVLNRGIGWRRPVTVAWLRGGTWERADSQSLLLGGNNP